MEGSSTELPAICGGQTTTGAVVSVHVHFRRRVFRKPSLAPVNESQSRFTLAEQPILSVKPSATCFHRTLRRSARVCERLLPEIWICLWCCWQEKNVERKPDGRRRGTPRSSKDCSLSGQISFSGRKDMCENVREAKWSLLSSAVDAAVIEPAASARTLNEWSCPVKAFRESSSYLRGRGYLGRNQCPLRSTPSKVSAACS